MPQSTDKLLDRLLETSQSLAGNPEGASQLVPERARLIESIRELAGDAALRADQLEKLEQVLALGDQARQPLTVQREVVLDELKKTRAARQAQESLKPYRPDKKGRLNIKL